MQAAEVNRKAGGNEIEGGSYRFLSLFLVSFSELVWFTLVRYYSQPRRDEHIPMVNKKGCLHSCFFPWKSQSFIFGRSFSGRVRMGDGREGGDCLCPSYNGVLYPVPVQLGKAKRGMLTSAGIGGERDFSATESEVLVTSVRTKKNLSEYQGARSWFLDWSESTSSLPRRM